jgi:PKD repeat protein
MSHLAKFCSLVFISLLLVGCTKEDDSSMIEVKAGYTFVREPSPNVIAFINTSQNADTYLWDFGDGTSSTLRNPVKTYTATGEYLVRLTVTNTKEGKADTFSSTISIFVFQGGLVLNGNFEGGTSPWSLGVGNPLPSGLLITQGGNTYFSINVSAVGNPFDVNLSQTGMNMTQGTTYRLTFDAWSDVNRSIIVGVGLSGPPWSNNSVPQNITTEVKKYTLDLEANFTSPNARVIFDMGAALGRVNIDNVTLNPL